MTPAAPWLILFVELDDDALLQRFTSSALVETLSRQGLGLAMAMHRLSGGRARLVRRLERAGVEVHAWLTLDAAQGYFATADNPEQVSARYTELRRWADTHDLQLPWVGLDFEPALAEIGRLQQRPLRQAWKMWRDRRSAAQLEQARQRYRQLVEAVRTDGRRVESYLVPPLTEGSARARELLERVAGCTRVEVDRQVLMLYRSYLGAALAHSYFAEAEAIALGCTGGGIDAGKRGFERRRLDRTTLDEELQAARATGKPLYLFSLEGCVENGLLDRLRLPSEAPPALRSPSLAAGVLRRGLATALEGLAWVRGG